MPIYEYRCSLCGHELEALQKLSEPALVACPACKQDGLTKLISAAGFQLKGTGWYVTDFRSGSGGKPAAKGNGKTEGAAEGKAASGDGDASSGNSETAASGTTATASSDGKAPTSNSSGGGSAGAASS